MLAPTTPRQPPGELPPQPAACWNAADWGPPWDLAGALWPGAFLGSLARVQGRPGRGRGRWREPALTWGYMALLSHRGRKLTPQGQRDLDRIAGQVRAGYLSHRLGVSGAWVLSAWSFLPWRAQPRGGGCRRKSVSDRLPVGAG